MTPLRLVALLLGLVVLFPPAAGAQALPVFDQGRTPRGRANRPGPLLPGVPLPLPLPPVPRRAGALRRRPPAARAGGAASGGATGREVHPCDLRPARRAVSRGAG